MDVRTTLRPGDKGTKAMVSRFGDRLICVRYRYDKHTRRRLKTVELIVDEKAWEPPGTERREYVFVRIPFTETATRRAVLSHGGRWDADKRLWRLLWMTARNLGLEHRVVDVMP